MQKQRNYELSKVQQHSVWAKAEYDQILSDEQYFGVSGFDRKSDDYEHSDRIHEEWMNTGKEEEYYEGEEIEEDFEEKNQ